MISLNNDIPVTNFGAKSGVGTSAYSSYAFNNSPLGKISRELSTGKLGTFLDNQLTGELDYSRQLELQDRANAFTAAESAKTRAYNAQQSRLQREFEERLSNTAYSRAFADMRRNGVNPYAALSPASTPTGAVASSSSVRGASSTTNASGRALTAFLGNVVASAFAYAGRAVAARTKLGTRQYFNTDGELLGGFTDFY